MPPRNRTGLSSEETTGPENGIHGFQVYPFRWLGRPLLQRHPVARKGE